MQLYHRFAANGNLRSNIYGATSRKKGYSIARLLENIAMDF